VFALQIGPIFHRILEGDAGLREQPHRFPVSDPLKRSFNDKTQPVPKPLVDKLLEQFHVFLAMLKHIPDQVFDEGLGQVHVTGEIAKSHFRLNHPELTGMS